MRKIIFILISFLFITNISYATYNDEDVSYYMGEQRELTAEKVRTDVDEIKSKIDTNLSTGKEIIDIIAVSIKDNGLKKTFQIHSSLFLPLFIFGILFLLYLRKRKT